MFRFHPQFCQLVMDLKMENTYRLRKDHGLRVCNYLYPMAYIFFTITSLKSKKIRERYILLLSVYAYNNIIDC